MRIRTVSTLATLAMLIGCTTTNLWNHSTSIEAQFVQDRYVRIKDGEQHADPDSGPMLPGHAVDVKSLLLARTLGGAHQMSNERATGSIEVGERADFVVIDRDILNIPADNIHEIQVRMTFFNGKRVAGRAPP